MSFALGNTARHPTPRMPFSKMKDAVLGKAYALTVVFIPPREMRELSRAYRRKDVSTDILAFPLSKKHGEIYLCMSDVKKKAPKFYLTVPEYLSYLFVHGLIHLKDLDHGPAMDRLERKFCKLLRIKKPG